MLNDDVGLEYSRTMILEGRIRIYRKDLMWIWEYQCYKIVKILINLFEGLEWVKSKTKMQCLSELAKCRKTLGLDLLPNI